MSSNAPLIPKGSHYQAGGGSGSSSNGSGSGGGKSSGGGGGGSSDSAWAKNNQLRQQNKAQRTADAGDRSSMANLLSNAGLLEQQIAAIRVQLGSKGFSKALNIHLANALKSYKQNDTVLMDSYKLKMGGLQGSATDNEKAAGDAGFASTANRIRERGMATANVALHGGGETDTLRAQQMSLRNWDANQSEVTRSYFDTLRGNNSSLRDLNADTKTARVNMAQGLTDQRGQLYDQYYTNRSQAWAQLSNLYGQRAQDYAQASGVSSNPESGSYKKNNPYGAARDRNEKASADALKNSSLYTGKAYKDPGISSGIRNWQGQKDFQALAPTGPAIRANSRGEAIAKPSGGSLRKWTS